MLNTEDALNKIKSLSDDELKLLNDEIFKLNSIIESQTKEIQELKNRWAVDKASLKLYYELHKINDKLREK